MCVIEKANNLVNTLLEEDSLDGISCLIVDELHMVGWGGGEMCVEPGGG